jgi:dihydrofolate reductase
MGKLTVTTFVTLDGVQQGPGHQAEDPSGGFDLGGWVPPHADEVMGGKMAEWYGRADAFLLGRRTYENFAGFWPTVTDPNDPIAAALNGRPKHVVSTTLTSSDWADTSFIDGDVAAAVRDLKKQYDGEVQVHASATLLKTLIEHDLVDEYRLMVFPVILGKGRKLFADGVPPRTVRHASTDVTANGVVIHVYEKTETE